MAHGGERRAHREYRVHREYRAKGTIEDFEVESAN
jgi:hypothetical protein